MEHHKVKVKLVGEDGNAFAIMGRVAKALRRSGQNEAADEYFKRAMGGDYDHLLQVTLEYVEEPDDEEERFDPESSDSYLPEETEEPSVAQLEEWANDGIAEATDGCTVEPDGTCPHGCESWLRALGYV